MKTGRFKGRSIDPANMKRENREEMLLFEDSVWLLTHLDSLLRHDERGNRSAPNARFLLCTE